MDFRIYLLKYFCVVDDFHLFLKFTVKGPDLIPKLYKIVVLIALKK